MKTDSPIGVQYDLQNVKHFFYWHNRLSDKRYCVSINKDGQVSLTRVKATKELNRKFIESWQEWSDMIRKEKNFLVFEYPIWSLVKDYRYKINSCIIAVVSTFLLLVLTWSLTTGTSMPKRGFILALLLGLFFFGLLGWSRYPKSFCRISITEDSLTVNFVDGSIRSFYLQNVKRYYFAVKARNAFIVLCDGTKLFHLERVSYWPILREYLLLKLETSEKT